MKKSKKIIKELFQAKNTPVLEMGGNYCSDAC